MKNAFLLLSFVVFSLSSIAQRSALTTAILAQEAQDFVKAKTNIDQVVEHEKTKIDPKAWFYKGLIYQNLAEIKLGTFLFNPMNPKSEAEIETLKGLAEKPIDVSIEAYDQCIEFDVKNRWRRKVDENLKNVLGYTAFNQGGADFQNGVNNKMDKDLLMQAYYNYKNMYKVMDLMTEPARNVFRANLLKSAELENLDLIKFNMANAAFNAENFEVAKKEYEALAAQGMPELYVYRNLAFIYKKEENVDAQRKLYNDALAKFDSNTDIGRALAIDEAAFYQEIGELDTLIEKLENAIKVDPTNSSLYNVLGGIYAEKCVSHNNAVVDEDADQSKKITDAEYKEYFDKSESLLMKSQELNSSEHSNYSQLGRLYLSEGSVAYNQNQLLGTSRSDLAKGKVLETKYKAAFGKAIEQFDKALGVEPENLETLDLLALAHLWNGNLAKNIETKNRIKEIKAKG